MRKLLIVVGALILLLIAAILILPSLVPSSVYKDKIEEQISASLDRDVDIQGDVSLSVFPTLRAKADSVKIANAEGFAAADFASMSSLEAGVKLMPLLSKKVEITKFTLIDPVISLEKKANGDVNWAFGAADEKPAEPAKAFARDGRYTDLDIALGQFGLRNGQIKMIDAQSGKNYALENVNVDTAMPGLDKPVSAKGDLVFNGTPMDIDLNIDTPKSFLNGEQTPFRAVLNSDLIDLSADGNFTASHGLTFTADFDSNIPSVSKLDAMLGIQNPYEALTETAALKGNLSFDGVNLTAKNATVAMSSALITNDFKGDFVAGPKPSASGDLALNIDSLSKLLNVLQIELPQVDVLESLKLDTSLTTDGVTTRGQNIVMTGKGELLDFKYTGNADFKEVLNMDGGFTFNSPSVPALVSKLNFGDVPATSILGDVNVTGKAKGLITALALSDINAKTNGDDLNASFNGSFNASTLALNGTFDASGASVPTLVSKIGVDMPAANALGNFNVSGQASGTPGAIDVTGLKFNTTGSDFTANYNGDIKVGETISLAGSFDAIAPSVKSLAAKAGMPLPYADAVGAFKASGQLAGTADALSISGLSAALTDGQMNVKFDGSATTGKALAYDGNLTADIPSLRKVAALNGTELPPSTSAGEIYGPLSISGKATGNALGAKFTNANFKMDHLVGTGSFDANLKAAKPFVDGVMDMQGLDLRPYMAAMSAQKPKGAIQPWSEEPLNFAVLNLFDGDVTVNTPDITTDRMAIGHSTIKSTIRNGVLKSNLPNANLYGGLGNLDIEVNAASAVPEVGMDFTLDKIDGKSFLGAAAGFTKLSGETGTTMKIRGAGRTQAEIMKSLNGDGNFKLAEGVVQGVDIAQFVSNLDANILQNTLSNKALPAGLGPSFTTQFTKLDGLFTIKNGVVTIGDFALNGNNVLAEGAGTLDLGNQKVDFSLRPRLLEGKGLAAFGIPIKLSGNFGSIKAGLDTDLMGKIVAERAKAQLTDKITGSITDKVGGDVGGILGGVLGTPAPSETPSGTPAPKSSDPVGSILGGVLGTQQPEPTPAPTPTTGETSQPAPQPAPQPATPEQAVGGLLGDLLGTPKTETPPPAEQAPAEEPKPEEKKEEDPAEKLLKGLFGND